MTGAPSFAPGAGRPIPVRAGIGLRSPHHAAIERDPPDVGWLEAHTENYFHDGGAAVRTLERLREHYPLSLHGVGLGLGSADPLDAEHLRRVRDAVRRFEPALVSEHACWTHVDGEHYNDLLPLPGTEEALAHLASRVREVQDFLGRQVLVENLSTYVAFAEASLSEGEFLAGLVEHTGCGLLLDVNNAYVNAVNLGLDVEAFFASLPTQAVREIHLAGHSRRRIGAHDLLIDDHGSEVSAPVWALYERALQRFGAVPTLIEWDNDVPPLATLVGQAHAADARLGAVRMHAA